MSPPAERITLDSWALAIATALVALIAIGILPRVQWWTETMSTAVAAASRFSLPRRFVALLPDVALLLTIGYSGKLIEQSIKLTARPIILRFRRSNMCCGRSSSD